MKIDEEVFEIIKKAEEITLTNYSEKIIWKDAENIEGYIENNELINIIEDLIYEVSYLQEEIEDLKNKEEPDNYDAWKDQQLVEGIL